jgi:hypothetical protein
MAVGQPPHCVGLRLADDPASGPMLNPGPGAGFGEPAMRMLSSCMTCLRLGIASVLVPKKG